MTNPIQSPRLSIDHSVVGCLLWCGAAMGARASRPKPYPHPDNGGSFASVVPSGFVHHPDLCHSPTSCGRTSSPSHLWTPPPQLMPVASPGRLPDTTAAQHIVESMDATLPLPRVGRLRAKLSAAWCICVLFVHHAWSYQTAACVLATGCACVLGRLVSVAWGRVGLRGCILASR